MHGWGTATKAAIALITLSWSPQVHAGTGEPRPVLRKGTVWSLILLAIGAPITGRKSFFAAEATSKVVSLMNFGCVHLPWIAK